MATLPLSDFVPLNYGIIVDIRDARWVINIRMPLYPSISIMVEPYIISGLTAGPIYSYEDPDLDPGASNTDPDLNPKGGL